MTSKQVLIITFCFVCLCCTTFYRVIQYHATNDNSKAKNQKTPSVDVINAIELRRSLSTPPPVIASQVQLDLPKVHNTNHASTPANLSTQHKNELINTRTTSNLHYKTHHPPKESPTSNSVRNCSTCVLIVLVLSSREEFSARTTIRETWGKNHDNVLFVTGASCSIPPRHRKPWTCIKATTVTPQAQTDWNDSIHRTEDRLLAEQQRHHDIIRMKDIDVYRTLALKLKAGYDWVIKNTGAQWILKIDTDCVVRVSSLEAYLASKYDPSKWVIVAASINKNTAVPREGKWAEYAEFTASTYPPWPSGAGHVISRPLARYVSENKNTLFNAQGEDVSMGIWMHGVRSHHNIQYKSDNVFLGHSGDCHDKRALVIGHQVSLEKMRDCFSQMDEVMPKAEHVSSKIKKRQTLFNVVISHKNISYYFPEKSQSWSGIVYGILSHNHHGRTRRAQIRNTWCKHQQCLFIIAGAMNDNREEIQTYQDVLFLDVPEMYSGENSILPHKTQTFLSAVNKHVPQLSYAVKVDDDSFVFTDRLRSALQDTKSNYWGFAFYQAQPIRTPSSKWFVSKAVYSSDTYPVYCSGSGYALSRHFLSCLDTKLQMFKFMPREDVATGLLAQACNVTATHAGTAIDTSGTRTDYHNLIIQHYVKTPESMTALYTNKGGYAVQSLLTVQDTAVTRAIAARRVSLIKKKDECTKGVIRDDRGAFCWNTKKIKTFEMYRKYRNENTFEDFARALTKTISVFFPTARSIGDFGASSGNYVRFYLKQGFSSHGYDGTAGIEEISYGAVENLNLAEPINDLIQFVPSYDVVACLEVGEHIPRQYTDVFLENIVSRTKIALFLTWAPDGQSGNGHVNTRSADAVKSLLERKGMIYHEKATRFIKTESIGGNNGNLRDNIQVYVVGNIAHSHETPK